MTRLWVRESAGCLVERSLSNGVSRMFKIECKGEDSVTLSR